MPSADILYACDTQWWRSAEGRRAYRDFTGLKVRAINHERGEECICRGEMPELRIVEVDTRHDRILTGAFGVLGYGGNSGFQAINLAVQLGARRLILAGFDMQMKNGVHWHGVHPRGLNNPAAGNVNRWRRVLDAAAAPLAAAGVEVVNATRFTALKGFPRMKLRDAVAHFDGSSAC